MVTAQEALSALEAGNRRYLQGTGSQLLDQLARRREDLAEGQAPAAVILGCSDSRVPPEVIFDQGLGELFVIRVAGNIVNPTQLASVQYAVRELGVRLVVVMGHSGCGAVRATLDVMAGGMSPRHPGLAAVAENIQPALAHLPVPPGDDSGAAAALDALMPAAVEANVRASLSQLREGLADIVLTRADPMLVKAAIYEVRSGAVTFLDD